MIVRLLAIIAAMCFASVAQAVSEIPWNIPGSGCVPDDATTKFTRHKINNASVRHAPTNVDPITLICPIAPFDSATANWYVGLTYQDSTGIGTTAVVRARLYRQGHGFATPTLVATATSNSSVSTTLNTIYSTQFAHTFLFNSNIYWVRVDLDRSSTSQTVIFHSLILTSTPF